MENIIKELEKKAMACSMSNRESRARKGAYVDAIIMIKEALRKPEFRGSVSEHEECRLCGEQTEQSGDDELCDNCFSRNDV